MEMEDELFDEDEPREIRSEDLSGGLYQGVPALDEARGASDPVLWVKGWNPYVPGSDAFFVAGYSARGLEGPIVGIWQFARGGDASLYGLAVRPWDRKLGWGTFDTRDLDWDGPGSHIFFVDEAWKPRRFSEVLGDYPGYEFVEDLDWPWPKS